MARGLDMNNSDYKERKEELGKLIQNIEELQRKYDERQLENGPDYLFIGELKETIDDPLYKIDREKEISVEDSAEPASIMGGAPESILDFRKYFGEDF